MKYGIATLASVLLLVWNSQPVAWAGVAASPQKEGGVVKSLKVTILSTMLAEDGIGEWGFAALVEADGHRSLFDTGRRPDTVLENARELGVDLTGIRDVILSHNLIPTYIDEATLVVVGDCVPSAEVVHVLEDLFEVTRPQASA